MPSIELKSIDRLKEGEKLLTDAGVFAKAGQEITDKIIQLLVKHKISYAPVMNLTYEEKESHEKGETPAACEETDLFADEIKRHRGIFAVQRERLVEKLKSVFQPFEENDPLFRAQGKKKQITEGVLVEKDPGPLYQPEIDAGSNAILNQNDYRFLSENIKSAYAKIEKMTRIDADTKKQKNRIPRQNFISIRLQSHYDGRRIAAIGDAAVYHAVDCALLFLVTMTNINKKRTVAGYPLSEERFDPDKSYDTETPFRYHAQFITDTAVGILLHSLGLLYAPIHEAVSAKPLLSREDPRGLKTIRLIQRYIYVVQSLLRNRHDVSSLSRMAAVMQKEFPDGTGFPPPNENRLVHEFIRLFHIIDTYDEMTNPMLLKSPYSRMDVIDYIKQNSGPYNYNNEKFTRSARFDAKLVDEFLQVLAPFAVGEKVYLYLPDNTSAAAFVGRVCSYLDSHVPLISILKDERRNKSYQYGEMLFYIPTGNVLVMENGKVKKRLKVDWVEKLRIFDKSVDPADITAYDDILFGKERPLSRRQQSLQ